MNSPIGNTDESPDPSAGASSRATRMIGKTVSHYRIVEKIAEGGMGIVYRAEDLRLKRAVALKFLHLDQNQNPSTRHAFIREAQATALLDHPNICTVFEISDFEGPPPETFIVMQFLGGGSVKDRLNAGPLPVAEAIVIAIQVGQGLASAHSNGLVHRDIKPGNIMLTTDNVAKIVDFGLALMNRHADDDATRTWIGATAGTLTYMAPEQARGQEVDHRADIWALGSVLFEMVAGKPPFTADAPLAVVYAILHEKPQSLLALRPDIPEQLNWIVQKALSASLAERYQRVDEMVADLRAIAQGPTSDTLIAIAPPEPLPSIAVLPFTDMSPDRDQNFFCEGIAEEIINAFSQVEGVQVASRGSSFHFPRSYDVREVGEKLKVQMVLEGSVRRSGPRLRITAQLTNTKDGYQIWSQRFDRSGDAIFDIQDEIAIAIAKELKIQLAGLKGGVRRYTENTEAYNLYLKGRYFWNHRVPDAIRKATAQYQEALELDPNYALAYCGLADCYLVPAYYGSAPPQKVIPLARAAAEKALEGDPNLPEAHTTLAMIAAVYDHDWAAAERHFKQALERNPNYAVAQMWYALFYLVPLGRFDEAVLAAKRAQVIDPLTSAVSTVMGACFFFQRRYRAAIEELERTVEMDPKAVIAHYYLGRTYWEQGDREKAVAELEKAIGIYRLGLIEGHLAYCYLRMGREKEAHELLAAMDNDTDRYIPAASRAPMYVAAGYPDLALDWLEKGYEERSFYLIWVPADPIYAPLLSEPRFQKLRSALGLSYG